MCKLVSNSSKENRETSHTKLASSRRGLHSPKALSKVVTFFLGSGLDKARIMGLCGFVKNLMICIIQENYREV